LTDRQRPTSSTTTSCNEEDLDDQVVDDEREVVDVADTVRAGGDAYCEGEPGM